MKPLASENASMLPQTSETTTFIFGRHKSPVKGINHNDDTPAVLDVTIAPPLSESEHIRRITQWTQSIKPEMDNPDSQLDYTTRLIDEGVQQLEKRDQEVISNAIATSARMSAATRLNLIADLKKIKQTVDPDDTITPRIVIQEFEKFMEKKKSVLQPVVYPEKNKNVQSPKSQAANKPVVVVPLSILQRKVQFIQPDEKLSLEDMDDWRLKAETLNVGFKVTYPPRDYKQQAVPTTWGMRFGTGSVRKPGTRFPPRFPTSVIPQLPTPVSRPKNTDWWRRKIRQGFIESDELMSKLVKQRKDDETFTTQDQPWKNFTDYEPYRPRTYASNAARANRMERDRLDKSMERMKKQHAECFGICPISNEEQELPKISKQKQISFVDNRLQNSITPKFQENHQATPSRTSEQKQHDYNKMLRSSKQRQQDKHREESKLHSKSKHSKHPIAAISKNQHREESKIYSKSRHSTHPIAASSKNQHHGNVPNEIKVIYERRSADANSTVQIDKENLDDSSDHTDDNYYTEETELKEDNKKDRIIQEVEIISKFAPTSLKARHQPVVSGNQKARVPYKVHPPKPYIEPIPVPKKKQDQTKNKKEWIQRVVEAHENNKIRNEAEVKAQAEKQKAATAALYAEILRNKTRLSNEVDFEKRKAKYENLNKKPEKKLFEQNERHRKSPQFPVDVDVTKSKSSNQKVLKFGWKPKHPKGLNLWLEGVLTKAKDEKVAHEKQQTKNTLIPLSSYQF